MIAPALGTLTGTAPVPSAGVRLALRRCDIDMTAGTVSIRRQYIELGTGRALGPPKPPRWLPDRRHSGWAALSPALAFPACIFMISVMREIP